VVIGFDPAQSLAQRGILRDEKQIQLHGAPALPDSIQRQKRR
jgi:hypothetical protein